MYPSASHPVEPVYSRWGCIRALLIRVKPGLRPVGMHARLNRSATSGCCMRMPRGKSTYDRWGCIRALHTRRKTGLRPVGMYPGALPTAVGGCIHARMKQGLQPMAVVYERSGGKHACGWWAYTLSIRRARLNRHAAAGITQSVASGHVSDHCGQWACI